jgi:hypothetical protein
MIEAMDRADPHRDLLAAALVTLRADPAARPEDPRQAERSTPSRREVLR